MNAPKSTKNRMNLPSLKGKTSGSIRIKAASPTGSMASMGQGEEKALINLKNVKLTADEQAFIKEYRRLEDLEREKGIKFF